MLIFDEKMMIFEAFLGPIHIPKTCFLHVYSRFFSTRKSLVTILVQSIRIAIWAQIFFVKKWVFFCSWKNLWTQRYRIMRAFFVIFCVFVWKNWKSGKTRPRGTLQSAAIKMGGSGGGWKSHSTGVDGCSNGVTVGEIALVVFYYSIIFYDRFTE